LPRRVVGEGKTSHFDYVLSQSVDESYFDGAYRWLWKLAMDSSLLEDVLDEDMINARLKEWKASEEDRQKVLLLFLDLKDLPVSKDKLKVILPQLKEEVHSIRMASALEEAAVILTEGWEKKGEERKEGFRAARSHIMQRMAELDQVDTKTTPVQEIRAGLGEFLEEYAQAKQVDNLGILTGFKQIDELTRGIQRGELWVMCGFTGEGKSSYLLNVAYNACIRCAKNVVYVSLEMPMKQVRRRMYTRHTNSRKFNISDGLLYKRIKEGNLNVDEEKLLYEASTDFSVNPDYGKLYVLQVPKSETVPALRERLTYLRSQHSIDLLVLDYASLMACTRKRASRQDEIIEVIEGLKSLALTFNEGEGLAVLTANQISRTAKEEANRLGHYGINFASETSAIEKNADLLAWILRNEELAGSHEAKIGIPKYRDGDVIMEFTVTERFSSCLLADLDDPDTQLI
jgi:replicative DNA helicase